VCSWCFMSYHIVSAQELADKLKMSLKTMYKLLNFGHIPGAKKIGGSWFVDLNIFEASFSKPTIQVKPGGESKSRHNLV